MHLLWQSWWSQIKNMSLHTDGVHLQPRWYRARVFMHPSALGICVFTQQSLLAGLWGVYPSEELSLPLQRVHLARGPLYCKPLRRSNHVGKNPADPLQSQHRQDKVSSVLLGRDNSLYEGIMKPRASAQHHVVNRNFHCKLQFLLKMHHQAIRTLHEEILWCYMG